MARKKPARPAARKATKKAAPRAAVRKAVKKAVKKGVKAAKAVARKAKKPLKKASRQAAGARAAATRRAKAGAKVAKAKAKVVVKKVKQSAAGKKIVATRNKAVKSVRKAVVTAKAVKAGVKAAFTPPKKANLDRPRKTVADIHGLPSSLGMVGRMASAAHSGREDMNQKMQRNNAASPALTAGDVDADWQSAEAVGDEAPGGDNPTPDQDVVDEIGRALGVEYADDEELQGGEEIVDRDRHRWELDPASKDDFDEQE
ncbi:MAG: DUF6335 family protein [Vicinamibacterales bacterium]|jgi:F0F1-type ATP synthase membrane subunit b/b'